MADREDPNEPARLYRMYGPVVYRRCMRLLRDRELARDATQEVFVQLVRQWTRSSEPDEVVAWIYRVATNHCLNVLRSARRHRARSLELEAGPSGRVPVVPAGGALEPQRLVAQKVLSQFDATTQAVAVGVLVDGMEHEELARVLGISRRTVSRRLDRFLVSAREYLSGGDA